MDNTFIQIVSYFKNASTPERVVSLIGNKKLISALLAWKSVIIKRTSNNICDLSDDNERWNWLWEQINWDRDAYLKVTGLKLQEISSYFEQLKGLKLIYPDGTIDKFAIQYLNSIIMNMLKKK